MECAIIMLLLITLGGDARGICFLKAGGFPVFYAKQSPKVLLFPKIFLP